MGALQSKFITLSGNNMMRNKRLDVADENEIVLQSYSFK